MSAINIPVVIVSNTVAICLALILLGSKSRRIRLVTTDDKLFCLMCFWVLCLAVLETVGFCLDGVVYPGGNTIFRLVNVIIFCMTVSFSFQWCCYIDYKLFESKERLNKKYPIVAIPCIVICLMSLANLFRDVFFGVTEQNEYVRLPLTILVVFVSYAYLTYGVILAMRYRKKMNKFIFSPILFAVAPIYVGSAVQLIFYGFSLMWISVMLGLTCLYINLQNEETYLDALTGVYNRNYLFAYMATERTFKKKKTRLGGMMIDINSFKQINDTYGHAQGDEILRTLAGILRHSKEDKSIVARYGGDEFVVLFEDASLEKGQRFSRNIIKEIREINRRHQFPYTLSISIGECQFFENGVDEFFKAMDGSMYEEKKKYYEITTNNRRKKERK